MLSATHSKDTHKEKEGQEKWESKEAALGLLIVQQ
jgi:hypothetical protein